MEEGDRICVSRPSKMLTSSLLTHPSHFDLGFADDSLLPKVAEVGERSRDILLPTSGSKSLEVYVNLAHGDEGEAAWYSARKLPRLRQLKKKYDSQSLFSHYNGISS